MRSRGSLRICQKQNIVCSSVCSKIKSLNKKTQRLNKYLQLWSISTITNLCSSLDRKNQTVTTALKLAASISPKEKRIENREWQVWRFLLVRVQKDRAYVTKIYTLNAYYRTSQLMCVMKLEMLGMSSKMGWCLCLEKVQNVKVQSTEITFNWQSGSKTFLIDELRGLVNKEEKIQKWPRANSLELIENLQCVITD